MRSSIALVLASILWGCAHMPTDTFVQVSRMQMTVRDGGAVYYGTLNRSLSANVVNMTVEVDRRVYTGLFELTLPNETFGLYALYGPRDAAPKTAQALSRTNYSKAILSSTEQRLLTCDFTDEGGKEARGLCVDEAKRVYDVILN
jgi:hypothetical protein